MNILRAAYNGFLEFCKDDRGNSSMTRLTTFINVLAALWVTVKAVQVAEKGMLGWEFVTLVFLVWVVAYLNKNVGRYLERISELMKK